MAYSVLKYSIVDDEIMLVLVYTIEHEVVIVKMLFPQRDDPARVWERLLI